MNPGVEDEEGLDYPLQAETPELSPVLQDQVMWDWVHKIETVLDSNAYNKDVCKIQVNNKWNFHLLEQLLVQYEDRYIVQYLKYGWPVERDDNVPLEMAGINHKGATEFQDHVDKYIEKELSLGAMIGPFEKIPFKCAVGISPLSTRAKRGSSARRIITDCSWPIGSSLNDGIDKDKYMGRSTNLTYPTVDDLAKRVYELKQLNQGEVMFFKEDLDRAFRQIYADLQSVPKLGFRWRNRYYWDLVLMMGCRISPYFCQKLTDMIRYIHNQMSYFLLNYVDDFLGAELEHRANDSHQALVRLLRDLNIERSDKKSIPPTTVIEFIGNLFDSQKFTIGITPDRRIEVLQELEKWRERIVCTRRQVESLVGKLQFMSNCIRPGRLFVTRLLAEMRKMDRNRYYRINDEMRKDIKWWYLFLPKYGGTSIMWMLEKEQVDAELSTDACMKGAGAIAGNEVYKVSFPVKVTNNAHITHLELWAIIIAIKVWGPRFRGLILRIRTDNEAVAQIINTGRSYDLRLQQLLRELVWWMSTYDCRVRGVHLPGRLNKIPDLLSRWQEGEVVRQQFRNITRDRKLIWKYVDSNMFNMTNDW